MRTFAWGGGREDEEEGLPRSCRRAEGVRCSAVAMEERVSGSGVGAGGGVCSMLASASR